MTQCSILICGSTGEEHGGAVINRLVEQNADLEILAVTRNASSASAQRLVKKSPKIRLVQGELSDPTALFRSGKEVASSPIWGVFSVQVLGQSGGGEEVIGKALIDASLKAGVKFFVYTSADRHGADDPTNVPHFIHKHNIEKHLFAKAKGTDMDWAVLRPVAFMEDLTDDFVGRVFATSWRMAIKEKPLQLIAVSDIFHIGAEAFLHPEEYKGRGISLAGDELTIDQFADVFKKTTGRELPETYRIFSWLIMTLVKDFGWMFKWFYDVGFGVNIQELRKEYPELKDFETWLKAESDFSK
ncbi:NmrA-like family protein [Colletotrichum graminicola]|uniref:NmrA-like family protein n=1 Tax=Colletotrichum graminicola (strain M1.001 / M2 / FGSC 10212) TaxID=645133 RepID=E3Q260_COLGM|nr:NmrA-like family protein [Colletotrichum graminicola M1.001]EFQ25161.1 NmrA-like family protein [Colletotrichum graminicola M1.001]WDK15219.1 NmrA-like family protein [Colletotrichum graminicola]